MSKISKRTKDLRSMGDHENFLKRIQKTLYYGKLPTTDRLSLPVTEFASELFSEPRTGRSLDRLHCKDAAYISRQACVSPCSFVLAMLYLERLKACNPDYLQCVAPSELFLVCLMVSSKFLHDYGEEDEVFMDEWALSGGISVKELIDLERQFLNAIQWEIFVNEPTFWNKLNALESTVAKKQGTNRGHFTYTELNALLAAVDLNNLLQYLIAITSILLTTYTAGLLTIVGSMFIVSNLPGNCLQPTQVSTCNKTHVILDTDSFTSNEIQLDDFEDIDFDLLESHKKSLDALDVLKTGILLASIKSSDYKNDYFHQNNNNIETISWDWWTSATMDWLSKSSTMIDNFEFIPNLTKYTIDHFVDMSIASSKMLDLEDQLHKGTRIRIQDQLEQTWHKEWTDTVTTLLSFKPLSYFHGMKAKNNLF